MKIAIVGSSHLTKEEEIKTRKYCEEIFTKKRELDKELVLISGGANGVDSIAENVAGDYAIKIEIYKPKEEETEYFRERNEKIAEACDILFHIATHLKRTECYHCNDSLPTHERSGGCWTAKMAKDKGKGTFLIVL